MMLDILRRIQGDLAALKGDAADIKVDLSDVKSRLDRLETVAQKQSRDSAAMLVMMRGTVGVFEERVSRLENNWPR